jgi:hypothetical protein
VPLAGYETYLYDESVGAGTGLGLSMTHSSVKKHEGTLELRNAEGGGTTIIKDTFELGRARFSMKTVDSAAIYRKSSTKIRRARSRSFSDWSRSSRAIARSIGLTADGVVATKSSRVVPSRLSLLRFASQERAL